MWPLLQSFSQFSLNFVLPSLPPSIQNDEIVLDEEKWHYHTKKDPKK